MSFVFLLLNITKIASFAPLPIRIIAGIAFIISGLPKLQGIEKTPDSLAR